MRRWVACVSGDRHLSFELDLVFDWLVLLFELVRDSNGICGLSVVRVKISTLLVSFQLLLYYCVSALLHYFGYSFTLPGTNISPLNQANKS